jgi:hypothetical protein
MKLLTCPECGETGPTGAWLYCHLRKHGYDSGEAFEAVGKAMDANKGTEDDADRRDRARHDW